MQYKLRSLGARRFVPALLASVLTFSGASVSMAETLKFNFSDSVGNTASWFQQSNPVCPGSGGCSFSLGGLGTDGL